MPKTKTHFEQVPFEIAKKAAETESKRDASEAIEQPKKKISNGNAFANRKVG